MRNFKALKLAECFTGTKTSHTVRQKLKEIWFLMSWHL